VLGVMVQNLVVRHKCTPDSWVTGPAYGQKMVVNRGGGGWHVDWIDGRVRTDVDRDGEPG
jgi:hypothetical protein